MTHGPIYGVRLIDRLPISCGMMQALPSRQDLENAAADGHMRLSAGYEVLLHHYRMLCNEAADDGEQQQSLDIETQDQL